MIKSIVKRIRRTYLRLSPIPYENGYEHLRPPPPPVRWQDVLKSPYLLRKVVRNGVTLYFNTFKRPDIINTGSSTTTTSSSSSSNLQESIHKHGSEVKQEAINLAQGIKGKITPESIHSSKKIVQEQVLTRMDIFMLSIKSFLEGFEQGKQQSIANRQQVQDTVLRVERILKGQDDVTTKNMNSNTTNNNNPVINHDQLDNNTNKKKNE
jgi:hypothetical protein